MINLITYNILKISINIYNIFNFEKDYIIKRLLTIFNKYYNKIINH